MSKELTDVSDRCGSCKFFMYRVINDTLKKWGGYCTKPNRKTYHDRSQKACKLYEPYNDTENLTDESRKELEELDIKVEEDIPTVQAIPIEEVLKIIEFEEKWLSQTRMSIRDIDIAFNAMKSKIKQIEGE